jgi:hypothetical protein
MNGRASAPASPSASGSRARRAADEAAHHEAADREWLERLAARVVALRLEVPALLVLETARPVAVIGSQALLFLQPFAEWVFGVDGIERLARVMARRGNVEHLATRIEALAGARAESGGR